MASPRVWIQATRPRTLAAAVVPVAVGTALVQASGAPPRWLAAGACLVGALLIQIGCNFANDVFDHLKGADSPARVGPQRAVAAGLISPRAMLLACAAVMAAALAVGCFLGGLAGWPIVVVGAVSIVIAILYTAGPYPLAYHGLGDLFVFLFFGLVAVIGTVDVLTSAPGRDPWSHACHLATDPWLLALAAGVGLQCTAIIAVNNLRDIPTDAAAGKRTLAVRLGQRGARWYYGLLHLAAVACFAAFTAWVERSQPFVHPMRWLWLWLPVAVAAAGGLALSVGVASAHGPALNRYLARSAALELLTGALWVIALSI